MNRFTIYDEDVKSALQLIKKYGDKTNEVIDNFDKKTDKKGNHEGSWQGINKPTISEQGMRAIVEKINEIELPQIKADITKLKNNQMVVNIKQFGAKCDGITNDTESFNRAIESLPVTGGIVEFDGNCLVDYVESHPSYLIKIDRPITLRGSGFNSKLLIGDNVPPTTDIVYIRGQNVSGFRIFWGLRDFEILPKTNIRGRHGIHIEILNPAEYISKMVISGVSVQPTHGKSLKLTNPTNLDGFFTSSIYDNYFNGGLEFERIGDSVNILRNTITGENIGIDFTTTPSARMVIIENNNITANQAIKVRSGGQVKILRNQIEQVLETTHTSMIEIGTNSAVFHTEIEGNNMNPHSNVNHIINLLNAHNTTIDNNYFFEPNSYSIVISSSSNDNEIGANNVLENKTNSGFTNLNDSILDTGIGTRGVKRAIAPLNGWVDFNVGLYGNLYCIKENGKVTITGKLKDGTTTHGTTVCTLPVGFRPRKSIEIPIQNSKLGVLQQAQILITETGNIQLLGQDIGNTFINLSGISFVTL